MNIIEALQNGKVVMFKDAEPRYYKMVDNKLLYSDDGSKWIVSNASTDIFKDQLQWIVLG